MIFWKKIVDWIFIIENRGIFWIFFVDRWVTWTQLLSLNCLREFQLSLERLWIIPECLWNVYRLSPRRRIRYRLMSEDYRLISTYDNCRYLYYLYRLPLYESSTNLYPLYLGICWVPVTNEMSLNYPRTNPKRGTGNNDQFDFTFDLIFYEVFTLLRSFTYFYSSQ